MQSLFDTLVAATKTSFTADTQAGDQELANPSTTAGLFIGLPVFGEGIPRGAVITGVAPLTISIAATVNALGVSMTTGFVTTSRRAKFTRDVPCPALFVRARPQDAEEIEYEGPLEALSLYAQVVIVSEAGEDPDVVPETSLNNFLDAIRAAMNPDPISGRFTLGGLVHWCRMIGKVDKDPGDIGPQAIAVADIEIIVP